VVSEERNASEVRGLDSDAFLKYPHGPIGNVAHPDLATFLRVWP